MCSLSLVLGEPTCVCGWVGVGAWVPPGTLARDFMSPSGCSEPGIWDACFCVGLFFLLLYFSGALAGTSSLLCRFGPLAPAQLLSWCLFPLLSLGPGRFPELLVSLQLSLQLFQAPSLADIRFLPVFPLGLSVSTTLLPSLSLCNSQPIPQAKGSGIWVHLPCLTLFLSGSLVHLSSCWFWGPTQRSLGDPGWNSPSLLGWGFVPLQLKGTRSLG